VNAGYPSVVKLATNIRISQGRN